MKIFLGSTGLKFLTFGLRTIDCLDKLSLKYCNIDKTGAKWIQEIIANINSKLRSLKLTGIFLIDALKLLNRESTLKLRCLSCAASCSL